MSKRSYSLSELEAMEVSELDMIAYGYKDGDQIMVDPKKLMVKYKDDLLNPIHKFSVGGMDWVRSVDLSDPIEVSINQAGGMDIEDGHHRYFCALKLGIEIKVNIEIKGNPVRYILESQKKATDASCGPGL